MIARTLRRRIRQSSIAAAHNTTRCSGTSLRRSGLSSSASTGIARGADAGAGASADAGAGIDQTYGISISSMQVLPGRKFFSTGTTKRRESGDGNRHQPTNPKKEPTARRFQDLDLHPQTLRALARQEIHRPTEIQAQSFRAILDGSNVVARARTGTGKTLAFLVPSLERLIQAQRSSSSSSNTIYGIPILVIAPTRELAAQIGAEAEKLVSGHQRQPTKGKNDHNPSLSVQVVCGGSSKKEDIRWFRERLPTILVATPGRLKDHLASTVLCGSEDKDDSKDGGRPFRSALQNGNLQTLVLDETDRLLELGFRRDIQNILSYLDDTSSFGPLDPNPPPSRQTLLFSATLAPDIMDVVHLAISPNNPDKESGKNYVMIDCVRDKDPTTHTNIKTKQSYIILPPERFWTGTMEFILRLMSSKTKTKKKTKIIVFFEMTRLAQLYSQFFTLRLGHTTGIWEIHGKMHQRERTVATRRFRNAPHGVLLTSDVSARGVDYPDVTHVVQVGAPHNRETYIHRLGRTGRAGKEGKGILILPVVEQGFVEEELKGLDLAIDNTLQQKLLFRGKKSRGDGIRKALEDELGMLRQDLSSESDLTGMEESVTLAYQSLVSYYFQTRRHRHTEAYDVRKETVAILNQLVEDFGLQELPAIGYQRAKTMGIEHLKGLNIRKNWEDQLWNVPNETGTQDRSAFDDWFGMSETSGRREKQANSIPGGKTATTKQKTKPKDRQR